MIEDRTGILRFLADNAATGRIPLRTALHDFAFNVCLGAFISADGNTCKAARAVGVHRNRFSRYFPYSVQKKVRCEIRKRDREYAA